MWIKRKNPATRKLWYGWMSKPVVFDAAGRARVTKSVGKRLAEAGVVSIEDDETTVQVEEVVEEIDTAWAADVADSASEWQSTDFELEDSKGDEEWQ